MAIFQKGQSGNPEGRKKGTRNRAAVEIKEAARNIVESPSYLASLKARLKAGDAPHMESLLFHYAYGKPVERIAPTDPTGTKEYGAGDLPTEERATRLLALVEQARTRGDAPIAGPAAPPVEPETGSAD